jgi:Zn-dependent membrane protease YugP
MNQANVRVMTFLAVGLFVSGIMLFSVGVLGLGLIITGVIFACTTVVINEIRDAKRRILEKIERQDESP